MAMGDFNKSKFQFSETYNNSDGKTSGSGFTGVNLGIIGALSFIAGIVGWFMGLDYVMEFFEKVLQLCGISAILLGARKVSGVISGKNKNSSESSLKPKKEEIKKKEEEFTNNIEEI